MIIRRPARAQARLATGSNTLSLQWLLAGLVAVAVMAMAMTARAAPVPDSFADLAERLLPAVVNISTTQTLKNPEHLPDMPQFPPGSPFEEFFKDFMEKHGTPDAAPRRATALGSGFIIDPSGLVVTNNHVIADADQITVVLHDGQAFKATIVGRDAKGDLALLRIKAPNKLPYVSFGNSDAMRVGDWVIAIGNPFGFEQTVTAGIVSGKGRAIGDGPYQNFIQTDASINPGNSGGPLFDMAGQLVGINTAIYSRSGGNIGLGFAIPSNMAKSVFTQLKATGKVVRGMIGVMIQPVTQDLARQFKLDRAVGALVGQVTPGGPAEKAGIKAGDIITSFQGQPINQGSMLPALVAETPVGTKAQVGIWRDGREQTVTVTIGELPEDHGNLGGGQASGGKNTGDDLGFTVQALTPELGQSLGLAEKSGLLVMDVRPGSIAAEAGLAKGDLIVEAGTGQQREPVRTVKDLETILTQHKDQNILLLVRSHKQSRFVLLKRK